VSFGLVSDADAAVSADSTDARAIMDGVFDRNTADNLTAKMMMVIQDKSGRKRERSLKVRSKKFSEGTRLLMKFQSPADVKNTGLLSTDYDSGQKDDDQWLYLPSLRKSTRIASTQKSGSFMGTDFTFADMTKSDPNDYDFKVVKQSVKVGSDDCWLIESRPKTDKAKRETGYMKSQVWVSKQKMIVVQSKAWVTAGNRIKLLKFEDIQELDGIWVIHKLSATTKKGKTTESTTVMIYSDLKINNPSVAETDFTQREMEKGI
jgi:outer membrane lipoprotein-sorting protein